LRKLFALAAVSAVAATPAYAATATVKVGDNWFVKPGNGSKTVSKGAVVRWKNVGRRAHTVTVTKGPVRFSRTQLLPGQVFRKRMRRRGTYTIICQYHSGQRMTLRVR